MHAGAGPVYAAVISHKMPHVALIGNTTNVRSRMESSCTPMRIQVREREMGYSSGCLQRPPSTAATR